MPKDKVRSEAQKYRWAQMDPETKARHVVHLNNLAKERVANTPSLAERLWDLVDGPWVAGVEWDDCWLFTGSWRSLYGYGRIRSGNLLYPKSRSLQAHNVAFELVFGPFAPGDYGRHACDNRLCCNPFHIAPGPHSANERDKWDKDFAWACTPLGEPPRWAMAREE